MILLLTAPPAMFKGKKPETVVFSDGRRVEVSRWKTVAVVIFRNCLDTPGVGERMMAIRGKVLGRQRTILAATPKGMNVPLEINPEMFFESKFDTESLLYVLVKRILEPVGYRCSGVSIQLLR